MLFTPLAELGHIHPLVGICQRLVRDGHTVGIHCRRSFAAQFARAGRAGIEAAWFGEVPQGPAAPPPQLAARMREPRWLEHWYRRALATTEPELAAIEASVRAFGPDVMSVDPLNAAAAIVAEQARLPWAAVSTNFAALRPAGWSCPFLEVGGRVTQALHPLAAARGVALRLDGTDAVSPWLNTVFTTAQLAPRPAANDYSHHVGPPRLDGARGDEPAFAWDQLDDRPVIYVASGGGQSLGFDAGQLLRLARAIDPAAVTMVIAAQALADDPAFRAALPPRIVVTGYAPQRRLLERAALAVIHGGVSSVNECLDVGCPMLVLPLGKDQPLQAELVRRAGAGLTLDPIAMTDDDCRGALDQLRAGPHRDRARALRDAYRATDATRAICAGLAALAAGQRPAPPVAHAGGEA